MSISDKNRFRNLLIAAGVLAAILLCTIPRSPWEFDEIMFLQGIRTYDPIAHHPPPPGYPVFMAVGHVMRLLIPSDLATAVTINFIASIIGFLCFALAFRNITGSQRAGIAGALLFYLSPVMLIHAMTGMSDPGALGLFAVALYFSTRAVGASRRISADDPATTTEERSNGAESGAPDAFFFGTFAALTVGWRPQFAIIVLPLLFAAVAMIRSWRRRALAVGAFTIICLLWLVPFAVAVGGLDRLIRFETSQAGYLAAHDADVSRSGWTPAGLANRFIAHPWGTKLTSFPLLLVAAFGFVTAVRRKDKDAIPLAVAAAAYLAFALRFMDPADGVRYALPSVVGVALFAGIGVAAMTKRLRISGWILVGLFGAGSVIFVSSVIAQRTTSDAPPKQAADYARSTFPANSVALYELPLWPHAQYFLGGDRPMRVNDGLAAYFDRPDIPLFIYADGASSAPGARTFRWWASDAYSKLTRNHYRVVSIIPLPPARRYRVVSGIYAPEREVEGEEWRWLAPSASLQLPHGPERVLTVRAGLPLTSALEVNTLTISAGGITRSVEVHRGRKTEVTLPVAEGAPVVMFSAARSFIPAEVPGSLNRDPRRLAVKLYDVHASISGSSAPPSASR